MKYWLAAVESLQYIRDIAIKIIWMRFDLVACNQLCTAFINHFNQHNVCKPDENHYKFVCRCAVSHSHRTSTRACQWWFHSLAAFSCCCAAVASAAVVIVVVVVAFMQSHLFSFIDLQLSILCALCTKLNWVAML